MPEFGDAELNCGYRAKLKISMEKKMEHFREQSRLRGESFSAFTDHVLQILLVLRHRERLDTQPAASKGRQLDGRVSPLE